MRSVLLVPFDIVSSYVARNLEGIRYNLSLLLNLLARLAIGLFLVDGLACGETPPANSDGSIPGQRPNIIFILSDDHACSAISAYGSVIAQTPNIDRIANEGIVFTNAMVENSICAPSRAAILTGKFSFINGETENGIVFNGNQQTFPKLLRHAGYQTALIGKWHLSSNPTGFDYWNILPDQGVYYNPDMYDNKDPNKVTHYTGYVTDIITDFAIQWLKETRDPDKPFLLMVGHKATHRDWEPPLNYLDLLEDQEIPEPSTLFDDYVGRSSAAREQRMMIANDLTDADLKITPPETLTPDQALTWNASYTPKNQAFQAMNLTGDALVRWKYQRFIKDYVRTATSLDDGIGRLLDYLDSSGLARNTVIIYASDQSFFLGEHGWFDKRWMYEPSLHMPFIVRWPGVVAPGSTNTDLVQNIDYAETLLEIAGVEIPSDMQGRSLVPLLQGKRPDDWRNAIYYHYYEYGDPHYVEPHYGVRDQRYKLIYYYQINEWELFDLQQDPNELKSVYDDVSYATVRANLNNELNQLRVQYSDHD
jgi:arylsulfatase A-like enzyme